MARTEITVKSALPVDTNTDNADWTPADVANGMMFENSGREIVMFWTPGGSVDTTLELEIPADGDGLTGTKVLTNDGMGLSCFNVLQPGVYNQRSGADAGKVYLNPDDATTYVAVVRVQ